MSATTAAVREGQQVTIDHANYRGTVWLVERVKYTKAIVRGADEATRARFPRGLDAPLTMLRPVDGEAPPAPAPAPYVPKPHRELGQLCRITRPFRHWTTSDLFVITAVNDKTVSFVRLGGEGGRYMRTPHDGVTIVDPADVLR